MDAKDRELVDQYRRGNVQALEMLVERHGRMLFGFILNRVGSAGDADEIFQETWFKVIRKIEINHKLNPLHINSSRGNICCHKYAISAILKSFKRFTTLSK